ncbi:MAG TPA: hypothetical protein VGA56_13320, partial [Opitutaceae bacterium]
VVTSGDTGGAVAAAFHGKPGVDVFVLFPEGRVSARQEHQLCCWGDNVRAVAVRGSFDDCQRLVKAAFRDEFWTRDRFLTSANSINVGRLLPQVVYYAWSSLEYRRRHGHAPVLNDNYTSPPATITFHHSGRSLALGARPPASLAQGGAQWWSRTAK